MGYSIRKGRRSDGPRFLAMVRGLAEFEHLEPPTRAGGNRLVRDIFDKRRIHLFVAEEDGALIGYALYYYSYSSFLARPTFYLEDLYVPAQQRKKGVGLALFRRCAAEAVARKCGRMEWVVLGWNETARRFYEKLGAKGLDDWMTYRLDRAGLRRVPRLHP